MRSKHLSLGSWKPQCCSFLSFLHLQWAKRYRVKSGKTYTSCGKYTKFLRFRCDSGVTRIPSVFILTQLLPFSCSPGTTNCWLYKRPQQGMHNFWNFVPQFPQLAMAIGSSQLWRLAWRIRREAHSSGDRYLATALEFRGLVEGKSPNISKYANNHWILWNLDLEWTTIQTCIVLIVS